MSIDLDPLASATRVLFSIELKPLQGDRFQPTGFPSLGAATYQTKDGSKLLVVCAGTASRNTFGKNFFRKPIGDLRIVESSKE